MKLAGERSVTTFVGRTCLLLEEKFNIAKH